MPSAIYPAFDPQDTMATAVVDSGIKWTGLLMDVSSR